MRSKKSLSRLILELFSGEVQMKGQYRSWRDGHINRINPI